MQPEQNTSQNDDPIEVPVEPTELEEIQDQPGADADAVDDPVYWQATEYIHRDRDLKWFVIFGLVVAVMLVISVWLMQAWTFAVLIVVMAAALLVYTRRPPAVINYALSRKGLYINDSLHVFDEFKSFGVLRDDGEFSIVLIPRRRFQPALTVYFPENSGEAIVDMFGARLPMYEPQLDFMDRLVRKLRL